MIGSTSRDYLLNREIFDYDFVIDLSPSEVFNILKEYNELIINTSFKNYGVIKLKYKNVPIDLVSLREESDYLDFRHPSKIKFIKDINIDYKRRDFTINAIYVDKNYQVIDPSNGYIDLKNKQLRFIKDTLTSIKEDPLRILRAKRFIKEYDLTLTQEDKLILLTHEYLLNNLNPQKIKEENIKYDKMLKRRTLYEK